MENSSILSLKLFIFILTLLKEARESICSLVGLILTIIDPKMVSGELLGQTNLSGAQALCIHELPKVIMIC